MTKAEKEAALAILKGCLAKLKALVKADAANRYSLREPVTFPPSLFPGWDSCEKYAGEIVVIEPTDNPNAVLLTLNAYESTTEKNICDGASMSPDTPKGVREAAIMHDPVYLERWQIAEHLASRGKFQSSKDAERAVRRWADGLFRQIVEAEGGSPFIGWAYYRGIRFGFPLYQIIKPFIRAVVLVAFGVAVAGAAGGGCAMPEDAPGHFVGDWDSIYTSPAWVQTVTGKVEKAECKTK